jgi:prolyl 4-hydroxylase
MARNHRHVDLAASGADSTAGRLASTPQVRRVPSPRLQQFIIPRWLDSDSCVSLIERIDAAVRPSTIADANGDATFRTSETCDLDHRDPLVAALDARLSLLTGIDARFGEPLQGQRYSAGQQFKFHTDYFEPDGGDFMTFCAVSGQRTWTLMIYLNLPEAGGATRFRETAKIHQPEVGKLLAWNNVGADGMPNPATIHAGMPVRKGRKYVITKWYRERVWPW